MKRTIALFAIAAGFSLSAMAADYTGYIIDQMCANKPAMKGDVECANKCIKGGSPAVLITDDGKIYKIADQTKVVEHAGHKVTISGTLKGDTLSVSKVSAS
jgi:hypothetical protein